MRWVYTGILPTGPISGTITAKRKAEAQQVVEEMYAEDGGVTDLKLTKHKDGGS